MHLGRVTDEEKAFGIIEAKQTTGVMIRNWITYSMRKVATDVEKAAYYSPNNVNKNSKTPHMSYKVSNKSDSNDRKFAKYDEVVIK